MFRILSTVFQLASINWENIDKNTYFTPELEILMHLRKRYIGETIKEKQNKENLLCTVGFYVQDFRDKIIHNGKSKNVTTNVC